MISTEKKFKCHKYSAKMSYLYCLMRVPESPLYVPMLTGNTTTDPGCAKCAQGKVIVSALESGRIFAGKVCTRPECEKAEKCQPLDDF